MTVPIAGGVSAEGVAEWDHRYTATDGGEIAIRAELFEDTTAGTHLRGSIEASVDQTSYRNQSFAGHAFNAADAPAQVRLILSGSQGPAYSDIVPIGSFAEQTWRFTPRTELRFFRYIDLHDARGDLLLSVPHDVSGVELTLEFFAEDNNQLLDVQSFEVPTLKSSVLGFSSGHVDEVNVAEDRVRYERWMLDGLEEEWTRSGHSTEPDLSNLMIEQTLKLALAEYRSRMVRSDLINSTTHDFHAVLISGEHRYQTGPSSGEFRRPLHDVSVALSPGTSPVDPVVSSIVQAFSQPFSVFPIAGRDYHADDDSTLPSIGIEAAIRRHFTSDAESDADRDDGFGPGWTFLYGSHIEEVGDNHLIWHRHDGSRHRFEADDLSPALTRTFSDLDEPGITATVVQTGPTPGYDIRSKEGLVHRFERTDDGILRLTQIRDRHGNRHQVSHDPQGQTLSVRDTTPGHPIRDLFDFEWSDGRIRSVMDGFGRQIDYGYAGSDAETSLLDSVRRFDQAGVNGAEPTHEIDVVDYDYDRTFGSPLLSRVTRDGRTAKSVRYTPGGRVREVTDASGVVTQFRYDDAARIRTTSSASGGVTRREIDAFGRLIRTVEPSGVETTYLYADDDAEEPHRQISGAILTDIEHDTRGNVVRSESAGLVTETTYESRFNTPLSVRQYSTDSPEDVRVVMRQKVDEFGNVVGVIDAEGNRITRVYDERGQLRSETSARGTTAAADAGSYTVHFRYNDRGQLTDRWSATETTDEQQTGFSIPSDWSEVPQWDVDDASSTVRMDDGTPLLTHPDAGPPRDIDVTAETPQDVRFGRYLTTARHAELLTVSASDHRPFANPENVALGASVTADASDTTDGDHSAGALVDSLYGDGSSYRSGSAVATLDFELAAPAVIHALQFGRDRMRLHRDELLGRLEILGSSDGVTFTLLFDSDLHNPIGVDLTRLAAGQTYRANFPETTVSHVRLRVRAADPSGSVTLDEVEILGSREGVQARPLVRPSGHSPVADDQTYTPSSAFLGSVDPFENPANLALGAAVTVNGEEIWIDDPDLPHQPHRLTDGAYGHGSSFLLFGSHLPDGETRGVITLDLGDIRSVGSVRLGSDRSGDGDELRIAHFEIETSIDGLTYQRVFDSTLHRTGGFGPETWSDHQSLSVAFAAVEARHIRITADLPAYGTSNTLLTLDEIEVFGPGGSETDPMTGGKTFFPPITPKELYRDPANAMNGATVVASEGLTGGGTAGGNLYGPFRATDSDLSTQFINVGSERVSVDYDLARLQTLGIVRWGSDQDGAWTGHDYAHIELWTAIGDGPLTKAFDSRELNPELDSPWVHRRPIVEGRFDPVDADRVRIVFHASASRQRIVVDEIGLWSPADVPQPVEFVPPAEPYATHRDGNARHFHRDDNIAVDAVVTVDGQPERLLNDGRYGRDSQWAGSTTEFPIELELDGEHRIDAVVLGSDRLDGDSDWGVDEVTVWTSLDGHQYQPVTPVGSQTSNGGVGQGRFKFARGKTGDSIRLNFEPVAARFVQLFVGESSAPTTVRMDEVEVLRSGGTGESIRPRLDLLSPPDVDGRRQYNTNVGLAATFGPNKRGQPFEGTENLTPASTIATDDDAIESDRPPSNLGDSYYGTASQYESDDSATTIDFALHQSAWIDAVQLGRDRTGKRTDIAIGGFAVQVSTDGDTFETVFDSTVNNPGRLPLDKLPTAHHLRASFPAVQARFVRLTAWAAEADGRVRLDEVEILAAATRPSTVTVPIVPNRNVERGVGHEHYDYDTRGRVESVTDHDGDVTTYVYDTAGRVTSVVVPDRSEGSPSGATTTTISVYEDGLLTSQTVGDDPPLVYTHDAFGRVKTITQNGSQTEYVYDNGGRVAEIVRQNVESPTGDGDASPTTSPSGSDSPERTVYRYDLAGRIASVAMPDGTAESYRYDANGRLASVADGLGRTATWHYDDASRTITETSPTGGVTVRHTDIYGQVIREDLPGGGTLHHRYDDAGRRVRTRREGLWMTAYTFDPDGNAVRTRTIDLLRWKNDASIDPAFPSDESTLDDLASDRWPSSLVHESTVDYDADGNVTRQTDATEVTSKWSYDSSGRLRAFVDPAGLIHDIDPVTRTTTIKDSFTGSADRVIQTTVDHLGRVDTRTHQHFDARGGLVANVAAISYDPITRTTATELPTGRLLESILSADGHESTLTDSDGRVVTTVRDTAGRVLNSGVNNAGVAEGSADDDFAVRNTSYTYDTAGRLDQVIDPLRGITDLVYADLADGLGSKLTRRSPRLIDGNDDSRLETTEVRDAAGRLTARIDPRGFATTYAYDSEGRLVTTTRPDPDAGPAVNDPTDTEPSGLVFEDPSRFDTADRTTDADGRFVQPYFNARNLAIGAVIVDASVPVDGFDAAALVDGAYGDGAGYHTAVDDPTVTLDLGRDVWIGSVLVGNDRTGRSLPSSFNAFTVATSGDGVNFQTVFDSVDVTASLYHPLTHTSDATYRGDFDDVLARFVRLQFLGTTGFAVTEIDEIEILAADDGPLPAPTVTNAYDGYGRIVSQTDHRGRQTSFTYDAAGRLLTETGIDPDGDGDLVAPMTTRTYDAAGRLETFKDARGNLTRWIYDTHSRVIGELMSSPDTTVPNGGHDPDLALPLNANLATRHAAIDAHNGPKRSHTYNDAGLLEETIEYLRVDSDPTGDDVSGQGQPAYRTAVTTYAYDRYGRETSRTLPEGRSGVRPVITRGYNAGDDRLAWIADADGYRTHFRYNVAGQITHIRFPDPDDPDADDTNDIDGPLPAPTRTFEYDAAGNLTKVIDADESDDPTTDPDFVPTRWTSYRYDALGRLETQTQGDPDGDGPLGDAVTRWTYDAAGSVTSVTDAGLRRIDYAYDPLGREIRRTGVDPNRADGESGADGDESDRPIHQTTYDAAGNVATVVDPDDGVTTFRYDAAGRVRHRIDPAVNALDTDGSIVSVHPTTTFLYDDQGDLTTVTAWAQTVPDPDVDGDSNNTAQPEPFGGSRTTTYDHDGWGRTTDIVLPPVAVIDPDRPIDPAADTIETLSQSRTYDWVGNVLTETDTAGHVTTHDYDARGNRFETTRPAVGNDASVTLTTVYDEHDRVERTIDGSGHVTAYAYDALGRSETVTHNLRRPIGDGTAWVDAGSIVTGTTYDADGNVETTVDPLGRTSRYDHDHWGRETSRTLPDPDGPGGPLPAPSVVTSYDVYGNVHRSEDHLGRVTVWTADDAGRIERVTYPDPDPEDGHPAPFETTTYHHSGAVKSQTDVHKATTVYQYDALGRLVETTLPDPNAADGVDAPVVKQTWNVFGDIDTLTDPDNHVTSWTYDAWGRVLTERHPDPDGDGPAAAPATETAYDAAGNIARSRVLADDPATGDLTWLTTLTAHDSWNRPIATTDPIGATTRFGYDDVGNRTSLTDANGNLTAWRYDSLGSVVTEINPLGDARTYDHDDAGRLTRRTDRNGRVTLFDHDDADRVTFEWWYESANDADAHPDDADLNNLPPLIAGYVATTYDDAGLIKSVTDGQHRDAFRYDDGDRLEQRDRTGDGLAPQSFAFTYTAGGLVATVTQSVTGQDDVVTTYGYDAAARPTSVHQSGVGLTPVRVGYDRDPRTGLIDDIHRYAGAAAVSVLDGLETDPTLTTDINRDRLGRRTGIDHLDAADAVLAGYDYTLDSADRTRAVDSLVDGPTTYQIDDAGRLLAADHHHQSPEAYRYDDVGNRSARWNVDGNDASTDSVMVRPVSDGSIRFGSFWGSRSFDGETVLPTKRLPLDHALRRESFLRFDISQFADVESASLELTAVSVNPYDPEGRGGRTMRTGLFVVDGDWAGLDGSSLTANAAVAGGLTELSYDHAERLASAIADWKLWPSDVGRRVRVDITAAVRAAIARGDRFIGLHLQSLTHNGNANYASVEAGDAGPALVIDGPIPRTSRLQLSAEADASIRFGRGWSSTNFGEIDSNVLKHLAGDHRLRRESFLQFDVSALTDVSEASLLLTPTAINPYDPQGIGGMSMETGLFAIPGDWAGHGETELTADKALAAGLTQLPHSVAERRAAAIDSWVLWPGQEGRVVEVDVTEVVRQAIADGHRSVAFHLQSLTRNGNVNYASREAGTTGPQLNIRGEAPGNLIGRGNRLLATAEAMYTYDREGNRTGRTETATGIRTTYVYDHRNRLTDVERFDAEGDPIDAVAYTYDTADRRITRTVDINADGDHADLGDVVETFVVDGDNVVAVTDGDGNVLRQYTHGVGVDEILFDQNLVTGVMTIPLADGQGTVRDLAAIVSDTSSGGVGTVTVVNHRVYDTYGNLISQTDPSADHLFGYTGRDFDAHTGLTYHRARWADPAAGVFLSEDPLGFGGGLVSLSSYVGGAPQDYTDPTGLFLDDLWNGFKKYVVDPVVGIFDKIGDVVSDVFEDFGDFLEDTWEDVREFAEDHPILTAGLALATGTFFVHAAGGFAAAAGKIGSLVGKAVGSIHTAYTPASSGIGGMFSLKVGNFASLNAGAGISGTSAFAGANVSVLGVPVVGVGKSLGQLGRISDPYAATLVGNFSDAVLQNTLPADGIGRFALPGLDSTGGAHGSLISGGRSGPIDVAGFLPSVVGDTAVSFGIGQLSRTNLPAAYGTLRAAAASYRDIRRGVRDVFAPPPPATPVAAALTPVVPAPALPARDADGLLPLPAGLESRAIELDAAGGYAGGVRPIHYAASSEVQMYAYESFVYGSLNMTGTLDAVDAALDEGLFSDSLLASATVTAVTEPARTRDALGALGPDFDTSAFRYGGGRQSEALTALAVARDYAVLDHQRWSLGDGTADAAMVARGRPSGGGHSGNTARQRYREAVRRHDQRETLGGLMASVEDAFFDQGLQDITVEYAGFAGDLPTTGGGTGLWGIADITHLLGPSPDHSITPAGIDAYAGPMMALRSAAGSAVIGHAGAAVRYAGEELFQGLTGLPLILPNRAPKTGAGTGFSGRRGALELKNSPLQPTRNVAEVINGRSFSGHALDQMQNRGIPLSVVEQALTKGTPFAGKRPGTQGFFDAVNKIRVIINSETGNVITVIPGKP